MAREPRRAVPPCILRHVSRGLFVAQQGGENPCVADHRDSDGQNKPDVLEPQPERRGVPVVDPAERDGSCEELLIVVGGRMHVDAQAHKSHGKGEGPADGYHRSCNEPRELEAPYNGQECVDRDGDEEHADRDTAEHDEECLCEVVRSVARSLEPNIPTALSFPPPPFFFSGVVKMRNGFDCRLWKGLLTGSTRL